MQNEEPNKVPQEIQNLILKFYTFQIKVEDYNVKERWEVYIVTNAFKSESNKHSGDITSNSIHIKHLKTPPNNDQTIANDPISALYIKLLTNLKDIANGNIIDDISENAQLVRKQKLITLFYIKGKLQ